MPAPKSQITQLIEGLRATTSLQGIAVLASAKKLAREGAPPRIVIFPVEGPIETAKDITSIRTVNRQFAARCWGVDFDQVCWVQQQLLRALVEQMPSGPIDGAGFYWESQAETWNTDPDSTRQGEEVEVMFIAVQSIDPASETLGFVESESISALSTPLSADVASDDVVANVTSTVGFSPYGGVISIDSEQIGYVGLAPTQFLGLTRGVNGTTPATHASGALVTSS